MLCEKQKYLLRQLAKIKIKTILHDTKKKRTRSRNRRLDDSFICDSPPVKIHSIIIVS